MRYAPYDAEYLDSDTMSEGQQLEYFLTRVFETEEIWGLDDGCEWIYRVGENGEQAMPVWPYEKYAKDAAVGEWEGSQPQAESLEDFMYHTLEMLIEDDVLVEIMAKPNKPGCLVSPHRLLSIFTGMIDAGEYRMDG
ncbi:DUF2750 domain-containing protein [Halioxenophilus sp. WMMB6]|uniref:DUF2750 domain-containing protein n=1 Tax=Halioxenophilus sp. WMMB6 TaxID=3073815 RepID=UPI00295F4AF2|nr:DUF2750 domain-containing protein [Halioxenophilus sp. WMMB6]